MTGVGRSDHWKLIGVGIVSFGSNFSAIAVLALSSFYHEATSTAFSAGTGAGFMIAPLYYTGEYKRHYYILKLVREL